MRAIIILVSCLVLISCSDEKHQKSVITKSSDEAKYVNEYFEIQVIKPQGWHSQDSESMMKLSKRGGSMMAGDNQNMKAILDESLKGTIPIFSFFESVPGSPVKTNPNIISVAENVGVMPGIKTGCDYLFHARQILESSAMKVTFSSDCKTAVINGSTFGYFSLNMHINGIDVLQKYYACVSGEHVISIVQTFFDDSSKAKVDGVLNTVVAKCG